MLTAAERHREAVRVPEKQRGAWQVRCAIAALVGQVPAWACCPSKASSSWDA